MLQFIEFVGNNFLLVGIFVVLLILFIANETSRGGRTISNQELVTLMNHNQAVVVDLRTSKEFSEGHITGALHIPYTSITSRMTEIERHKEKPIVLTCKLGQHSGATGAQLRKAGFKNIQRLAGGMNGWRMGNMPVVKG